MKAILLLHFIIYDVRNEYVNIFSGFYKVISS